MLLPLLLGQGTGGGGGPTPLVFGSYLWSGSISAASYTWTGMAIGAAASDRWVIAALQINNNGAQYLASVTIGGVAATLLYSAPAAGTARVRFEYWAAPVPTISTRPGSRPAASARRISCSRCRE